MAASILRAALNTEKVVGCRACESDTRFSPRDQGEQLISKMCFYNQTPVATTAVAHLLVCHV